MLRPVIEVYPSSILHKELIAEEIDIYVCILKDVRFAAVFDIKVIGETCLKVTADECITVCSCTVVSIRLDTFTCFYIVFVIAEYSCFIRVGITCLIHCSFHILTIVAVVSQTIFKAYLKLSVIDTFERSQIALLPIIGLPVLLAYLSVIGILACIEVDTAHKMRTGSI